MVVHPYLVAYRALIGDIAIEGMTTHDALDRRFEAMRVARCPDERPLRFVPSPKKVKRRRRASPAVVDAASSYDGSIALRREVPTRSDDLHDHCNFLVWMAFPRSKRALHERQLRAKEAWIPAGSRVLPGARTREQDALTLFDEGGFVTVSDGTGSTAQVAFGHALLEHFARAATPIAATEMRIRATDARDPDAIDRAIAARITADSEFLAPGLDGLVVLQPDGSTSAVTRAP